MPLKLFVYGTLKKGFGNHHWLGPNSKFIEDSLISGFTMHDLSAYPAVKMGGHANVYGEFYEVPDNVIPYLDALEGHPDLFQRTEIRADNDEPFSVYLMDHADSYPLIASGKWEYGKKEDKKDDTTVDIPSTSLSSFGTSDGGSREATVDIPSGGGDFGGGGSSGDF